MTIEFTGTVFDVLPLASGEGRNGRWARSTVVFELSEGRFTTKIACENTKDAEKFSKLRKGQTVKVKADLSSREYNGRWFTSAVCWDFKVEGGDSDDRPY